jgi:hypothetical protein
MSRIFIALLAAAWVSIASAATPPETHAQIWVGTYDDDDVTWDVEDRLTGASAEGELGTLWMIGVAAQQLWGDGAVQYGWEGGVLGTRKEDETNFRDAAGVTQATVDTLFYSVGGFVGAVASIRPIPFLRAYVAAGPAVTWGYVDEDEDESPLPGAFDIDISDGTNDVVFEPYARIGVEFILPNDFALGVSARYSQTEFDFDEGGDIELDDTLWLITLGGRI